MSPILKAYSPADGGGWRGAVVILVEILAVVQHMVDVVDCFRDRVD